MIQLKQSLLLIIDYLLISN